jgi:hypothetical protein
MRNILIELDPHATKLLGMTNERVDGDDDKITLHCEEVINRNGNGKLVFNFP